MRKNLKGKTILITGASSGLGEELAKKCAESGASIILIGRNQDRLAAVVECCGTLGAEEVQAYPFDLGEVGLIPALISKVEKEVGAIDALINNAGFGLFEKLNHTTNETIQAMFDVNVVALIALSQSVIPSMKKRGSGHIINIASQAGKLATPKSSIYSATKHAVIDFSNSLRMEVADDGILVTTVNPGPINTAFFDQADDSGKYAASVKRWMLDPEVVATKTVDALFTRRREINMPRWMNIISKMHVVFPGMVETLGKKGFNQK